MACFLKRGDTFRVSTRESLNIHERLPRGTYSVGCDPMTGEFYLERMEDFNIEGKIYGDTDQVADRIIKTFYDRTKSTGVLLCGEKGSGKTMLSKRISIKTAKDDIPTLVVNSDWCGESFNAFIQSIGQPAVVIFDEFEKVYSGRRKQEALLTLLDGVYPSKKLFIFTCNDKWKLNANMQNRPGRIYYMLEYHGVDEKFIREYCEDKLKNKAHINMVCATARVFRAFNFDMLQALVEEMNRYGETPAEALKFLNARADFETTQGVYHVKLVVDGKRQKDVQNEWQGNPLAGVVSIYCSSSRMGPYHFTPEHFQRVDSETGAYIFANKKKNCRLFLTPKKDRFDVNFEAVQNFEKASDHDDPASATDSESSDSEQIDLGLVGAAGGRL